MKLNPIICSQLQIVFKLLPEDACPDFDYEISKVIFTGLLNGVELAEPIKEVLEKLCSEAEVTIFGEDNWAEDENDLSEEEKESVESIKKRAGLLKSEPILV